MKNTKEVSKVAAQRMVQGDDQPWRKKCESYGFLLAKSMIIMDAEMLKERMKPENIKKNIGRDQWEYSNDRVIGTSKGLNFRTIVSQVYNPIGTTGTFPHKQDDSLARETSFARTTAHTGVHESLLLLPDVLQREFTMGQDLLDELANKINMNCFKLIADNCTSSEKNLNTVGVFLKLVWLLNNQESDEDLDSWERVLGHLNDDLIQKARRVTSIISENKYDIQSVLKVREEFKRRFSVKDPEDPISIIIEFI